MGLQRETVMTARPPKMQGCKACFWRPVATPQVFLLKARVLEQVINNFSFDKGKPGESRGRKATGSKAEEVPRHDCQVAENECRPLRGVTRGP